MPQAFVQIRKLYHLPEKQNYGFTEAEVASLEKKLNLALPPSLKTYYLTLGRHSGINFSHNRLLQPEKEVYFSIDRYLILYEENQVVAFWGIKEKELRLDNPPIYGNYSPNRKTPDWFLEAKTTSDFFLLMAVYNGVFGGLKFNASFFGQVNEETVRFIEEKWVLVEAISRENQRVYTDQFHEVISLSFDINDGCTGIFIGTSSQERFDSLLSVIKTDWYYTSYDDMEEV
ncbi:MAG: hypothetical protein ACFB0B_18370 [Thermonemataceae bacterium]